jgi:hypothetical protein
VALVMMDVATPLRKIVLTCIRPTIRDGKTIEKIFEQRPMRGKKPPSHDSLIPHEPTNKAIDLQRIIR